MSDISDTLNPYQPPAALEEPETPFRKDTEFLISYREILCRENVTLPRICIHTGETDDLETRQKLFHFVAGLPAFGLFAVFMGLIIAAAASTALVGMGLILVLVLVVGGMFLQPLLVQLRVPGLLVVDATWFVSRRYLQRARRRALLLRIAAVSIAAIAGVYVGLVEGGGMTAVLTGIAAAVATGLLSVMIRSERSLHFAGRKHFGIYRGLMVLTGHSRHFTDAVNRVIHGLP